MPIIDVAHVSKIYPSRRGRSALLGRGGIGAMLGGRTDNGFAALRDVNLQVEAGQSLGIIGRNGSGKSTLLKILAGVTLPSFGTVQLHGRVASLLELGAGFHPMLTGRENVFLNAGLLGMRHREVRQVFDSIVDFSGIGEFIDQPVDTYSSGMYVRIAFSVAVHTNPDIFLVDEVLAVGDEDFQRKCRIKIAELKEQGKTIVFVSHDLGIVHTLCDQVLLLTNGEVVSRGTPQSTIDYYLRQIGHEGGIHNFRNEHLEAIFSHGRISVFSGMRELTVAQGMHMQLRSLDQPHYSTSGLWEISERSETACSAKAEISRLPVRLHWQMHLEDHALVWRISIEVMRTVTIEHLAVFVFLPAAYDTWHHQARQGEFPAIEPGHVSWDIIVPVVAGEHTAALSGPADALPLLIEYEDAPPGAGLALLNSDYFTGARIAELPWVMPKTDQPLQPGLYEYGTLRFQFGPRDALAAWAQAQHAGRERSAGLLSAHLAWGKIELSAGDASITTALHLHTQILSGGLWHLSPYWQWKQLPEEHGALRIEGSSARIPVKLEWSLASAPEGLRFRVYVLCDETTAVEEYNITLMVKDSYTSWRLGELHGNFPPIAPDSDVWVHLNDTYPAADELNVNTATGDHLRIVSNTVDRPLVSTVLNAMASQQARVLQIMSAPDPRGVIPFAPGRHLVFDGLIRLDPGA